MKTLLLCGLVPLRASLAAVPVWHFLRRALPLHPVSPPPPFLPQEEGVFLSCSSSQASLEFAADLAAAASSLLCHHLVILTSRHLISQGAGAHPSAQKADIARL